MMSYDVDDAAGRVQGPVQREGNARVGGRAALGARQVLVALVLADAAAGLEVRRRGRYRAAAAAHHRARYRLPLCRESETGV